MGIVTDREIEIKCPECEYAQAVTIGDVIEEKQVICGGCKKTINLKLKGDDPTKIEQELNKLLKSIPKKLTIKI